MTLSAVGVRSGRMGFEWLRGRIADAQRGDRLAPVTVLVPNHYVGLWLRRELAQTGYANVRFEVVARLAERLGARSLAESGHAPLRPVLEDAVIRTAVAEAGERFGDVAANPALVDTLRDLFHSLREYETTPDQLLTWRSTGRTAEAALTAFAAYEHILDRDRLYDDRTALNAASAAIGAADLREVGALIVYLPARLTPAAARFIRALSHRVDINVALAVVGNDLGDEQAAANGKALGLTLSQSNPAAVPNKRRVLLAPTAEEEVRAVVRSVLVDLAAGVPLNHIGILFRAREPYAQLLRETLTAAGLPWAALEGRPLSDSVVARGLLALLTLRERDFARVDVLEWRSTLPHAGREDVSFAEWNRLTREAGVVRGADQWRDRLARLADELRRAATQGDSEAAHEHHARRAGRAERVAAVVAQLVKAAEPPTEQTWPAYVTWARTLRATFVPPHREQDEQDASRLVDDAIQTLGAAASLGGTVSNATFVHALESALRAQRRPQGSVGVGVVIGMVSVARGFAFDRLYLVGMADGLFPPRRAPDPIFPDSDPLQRRATWLIDERNAFDAALAGADQGAVTCTAPVWDADVRPVYAAPWLIEIAEAIAGRPITAAELRTGTPDGWERLASPDAAIASMQEPLDLAERRLAEVRTWHGVSALGQSALARRDDLPLGRALLVREKRRSNTLTAFDGNLREVAGATERLGDGLGRGLLSASAIERWCTCPFHYFLGRVLYVEATAQPEDDETWTILPAVRGSLMHDILEKFMAALLAAGRPRMSEPYSREDHERLDAIATEEFRKLEVAGQTGYRLAWENEREAILRDLHTFLMKDQQYRQDRGVIPAHFEQGFGMKADNSWPELQIPLADGKVVRLRGAIDRVDVAPDREHPQRAIVTDYKTGSVETSKIREDPVRAGKNVQLSLYSLVVRDHLRALGASEPEVSAAYWQIVSKHKFARTEVSTGQGLGERLAQILERVHEGLGRGAFPQRPGEEEVRTDRITWENCSYCEYDRVCPAARGLLAERKEADPAVAVHLALAPQ